MVHEVLLPITVPSGEYCWLGNGDAICTHFSNYGGHPVCELGSEMGCESLEYCDLGVKKHSKCAGLEMRT